MKRLILSILLGLSVIAMVFGAVGVSLFMLYTVATFETPMVQVGALVSALSSWGCAFFYGAFVERLMIDKRLL